MAEEPCPTCHGKGVVVEDTRAEDSALDAECPQCHPFPCDDPDNHMRHTIPSRYTPLMNRGCRCGADFDGRDCMCFED